MDELDELARALARRVETLDGVEPVTMEFERGAWVRVRLLGRKTGGKDGIGTARRASGGVGVEVTLEPAAHNPAPLVLAWRLGPDWTPGSLETRIRYALRTAREQHRLRQMRDELWAHLEHDMTIGKRDELEMEMAAEAAAHGYCDILEEMGERDIEYWLWWLSLRQIDSFAS